MALPQLPAVYTADEFNELAHLGILPEDARVELIGGRVIEMTPIGPRHAQCVRRLGWMLSLALREHAIVDVQNPAEVSPHDVPQPDVKILKPRSDAYPDHPRPDDILLVVEVSDSTLPFDRDVKMPLYARTRVREAWLVDLNSDTVVVHRRPVRGRYAETRTLHVGETVSPLAFPGLTLELSRLFA